MKVAKENIIKKRQGHHRYPLIPFCLCVFIMSMTQIAAGASITLTWNRNQEPDIAAYRIYWGTQSHNYTESRIIYDTANLPFQRSFTVNGLDADRTYYFALKAVDLAGHESEFSDELMKYISDRGTFTVPACDIYSQLGLGSDFDRYPVVSGDVNGDGLDDIVLFGEDGVYVVLSNGADFGQPVMWYDFADNENYSISLSPGFQEKGWTVFGPGDFNGDNYTDILLSNAETGQIAIWFIGETGFDHEVVIDNVDFENNSLLSTCDFNGDDSADLVWRSNDTGQLYFWVEGQQW